MLKGNFLKYAASFGLLASAAVPAHASLMIIDGWGLKTPLTTISNIGRLNLLSGNATVEQQLSYGEAPFVENGVLYSVTKTPDTAVGLADVGAPEFIGEVLTITFNQVVGHTTPNAGAGSGYVFDSGTFTIWGVAGPYAAGRIIGLGGHANATPVAGGYNSDSTVLGYLDTILSPALKVTDRNGNSLMNELFAGNILFQIATHNISSNQISVDDCSFAPGSPCASFDVAMGGDAYLVRNLPDVVTPVSEPGSLAILSLGLLTIGAIRRNSQKALSTVR